MTLRSRLLIFFGVTLGTYLVGAAGLANTHLLYNDHLSLVLPMGTALILSIDALAQAISNHKE